MHVTEVHNFAEPALTKYDWLSKVKRPTKHIIGVTLNMALTIRWPKFVMFWGLTSGYQRAEAQAHPRVGGHSPVPVKSRTFLDYV